MSTQSSQTRSVRCVQIIKDCDFDLKSGNIDLYKKTQAKLRSTRLGKFFELDKSFMCAGGVKVLVSEKDGKNFFSDGLLPLLAMIIKYYIKYIKYSIEVKL